MALLRKFRRLSGFRDCKVYDFRGSCILQRLPGWSWDHKVFDFGHSFYLLPGLFAPPATFKSLLCMR